MLDPHVLAAVDEIFATFHSGAHSPGLAYAVVAGGTPVHAVGVGIGVRGIGPIAIDSVFRIASMTKSFTAAAALLLRDEGLLTLDEPVRTYVPELRGAPWNPTDSPALTLRHLLTMSAGLATDDPWADRQESLTPAEFSSLLDDGSRFAAPPGTTFGYSNLGYAIIGRAISNVSGTPYHEFVRSRLLGPLGLKSTCFSADEVGSDRLVTGHRKFGDVWEPLPFDQPGEFSSIGGLYSCLQDLATWIGGFVAAIGPIGSHGHDHPLSRASRREMQQLHRFVSVAAIATDRQDEPRAARAKGYGYGLNVEHDNRWGTIVGHSGGYPGFGSHMRWHAGSGMGVLVCGNGMYAPAGRPGASALDLIMGEIAARDRPSPPWPQTVAMQADVQRLILDWDEMLADRLFAVNMDLDLPRNRRRANIQAVVDQLGPVHDPTTFAATTPLASPSTSASPSAAQMSWVITGTRASATVEIWLTPQAEPLLQTLSVTLAE